ncbi:DUF1566 domain-containing protein [Rheinheimera baltica]|uniref:DUF1566 domain-containing protein n=1 Tax=Rheinheimera baltica TaxID=67576 RepID=A0ABT9I4R8_9GAMM|nr:DUF1566 domain-containing protein [Rheinheimera baltica]MDP5138398.1 DUF1566 domain-containing protein [Rheinheimera baltica]
MFSFNRHVLMADDAEPVLVGSVYPRLMLTLLNLYEQLPTELKNPHQFNVQHLALVELLWRISQHAPSQQALNSGLFAEYPPTLVQQVNAFVALHGSAALSSPLALVIAEQGLVDVFNYTERLIALETGYQIVLGTINPNFDPAIADALASLAIELSGFVSNSLTISTQFFANYDPLSAADITDWLIFTANNADTIADYGFKKTKLFGYLQQVAVKEGLSGQAGLTFANEALSKITSIFSAAVSTASLLNEFNGQWRDLFVQANMITLFNLHDWNSPFRIVYNNTTGPVPYQRLLDGQASIMAELGQDFLLQYYDNLLLFATPDWAGFRKEFVQDLAGAFATALKTKMLSLKLLPFAFGDSAVAFGSIAGSYLNRWSDTAEVQAIADEHLHFLTRANKLAQTSSHWGEVLLAAKEYRPMEITVQVSGNGRIYSDLLNFECRSSCVIQASQGEVITLYAQADGEQYFSGWQYACSGTSAQCGVHVKDGARVAAMFAGGQASAIIERRYLPIENGQVIRDMLTGLDWQRCAIGQVWSGSSCGGSAQAATWQEAAAYTATGGFALPSIQQLRTLVYCSDTANYDSNGNNSPCGEGAATPTIQLAAFNNAPGQHFWSSSAANTDTGRFVSFGNGSVSAEAKTIPNLSRLVRVGQPGIGQLTGDLTIVGDVVLNGNADLNGFMLTITGNLIHSGGTLKVNGGRLVVQGDYRVQQPPAEAGGAYGNSNGLLQMTDANDYVLVQGDFVMQSAVNHSGSLSAGVLEVRGHFTQVGGSSYSANNFRASGTHRVVLSGQGQQVQFASTSSQFAELELAPGSGSSVVFVTPPKISVGFVTHGQTLLPFSSGFNWTLAAAQRIAGDLQLTAGELNLAGQTLTVEGNLIHSGGLLKVNGGSLVVQGDYRVQQPPAEAGGAYGNSNGLLQMTDADDYVLVQGDFVMQSGYSHNGYLTAGVLEVRGHFTQIGTGIYNKLNFASTGSHVVILSGTTQQIVMFESSSSGFNTLMHANSNIVFQGAVRIRHPEQFQLNVVLSGKRRNQIASIDEKLLCGSQCSAFYPRGEVVILSAAMVAGDIFNGWPEPCILVEEHCQITIDSPIALELSFAREPVKNRRKSKLMLMIISGQAR